MMPLTMARAGEKNTIVKIGGKEEVRRFLESLGFVAVQQCGYSNADNFGGLHKFIFGNCYYGVP